MSHLPPALLAFVIASSLAALELITSKYPRTASLLRGCWPFYVYAAIYGVIAFVVMFVLSTLIKNSAVTLEGLGLSSPWIQALVVGVTFKSFLHVRLFTIQAGSKSFPIGVETLVQLFEPWLLRTIELDHFIALRNYIAPRARKFPDLATVRTRIADNLPPSLSKQSDEGKAFLADVQQATSINEAMRLYMSFVGRKLFDAVFRA